MGKSVSRSPKPKRGRSSPSEKGLLPLTATMEDSARVFAKKDDSPLKPKTRHQAEYINAIQSCVLTFGLGPAGTGKTFIATALAVESFLNKDVEKIIITRPVIEAGEKLGFLPGELEDKVAPYFAPVRAILDRRMGSGAAEFMIKAKKIEFVPLAYMRGLTLDNSFVILDEAQNTTPIQMKLFITRIGEGSKVVVDGDTSQRDIPGMSGLADLLNRVSTLDEVRVVRFTHEDVVRSGLVAKILRTYECEDDGECGGLERFLSVKSNS